MKHATLMLAALTLLLGGVGQTKAGMMGATVDVAAYYPDTSSVYDDPGQRIVTSAIEYPVGSYPSYNSDFQVDVADNSITITNNAGTTFSGAAFNGFIMDVLSGPTLLSASVDPSSAFLPVSILIVGGDQLQINFEGVSASPGSSIIDFTTSSDTTAAPEPASFTLLGIGAVCSLGYGWRRRRPSA